MHRYFYDWEFSDQGDVTIPISLGMVNEKNEVLYIINKNLVYCYWNDEQYYWKGHALKINDFVENNVMAYITKEDVESNGADIHEFGDIIQGFISQGNSIKSREDVELWGYYPSYDHVCLAQTFGTMMNLPEPIPMRTRDVLDIGRGREITIAPTHEHHPVSDAVFVKELWEEWR